MKIIVIGGNGLIGKQLVAILRERGHEVRPASRSSGVDTLTGAGLAEALSGADVVVDVSNAPSFADAEVMHFFETAGTNIAAAERTAGVKHHVALGVVGTDRMQQSGYFRAKLAQERIIESAGVPYTIVRATQFYEFLEAIAGGGTSGDGVRLPTAALQPIASADVASMLADIAIAAPANAIVEIAGPDRTPLAELAERLFKAKRDPRRVIADPAAGYFGAPIDDGSLTAGPKARLGPTTLDEWLATNA